MRGSVFHDILRNTIFVSKVFPDRFVKCLGTKSGRVTVPKDCFGRLVRTTVGENLKLKMATGMEFIKMIIFFCEISNYRNLEFGPACSPGLGSSPATVLRRSGPWLPLSCFPSVPIHHILM